MRFSPGGEFLAGVQDGNLRVWDLADGALLPMQARVAGRAFDLHPVDPAIAFADPARTVHLCQLRSSDRRVVGRLTSDPKGLRFDPDGGRLAAYREREPAVQVLALADGKVTRYPLPAGAASVAWSPDGRRVAAGGWDGSVFVCQRDAPAEKPLVFAGHRGPVMSVAFHPTHDLLASGSWDQTVRVWDAADPAIPSRLLSSASYQALEFTKDGRSLGLGRDEGRVWVWEVLLPAVGQTVVRADGVWESAESPDGRWLAGIGDAGLTLWDLAAGGRPALKLKGSGRRVWFAADGRGLTTGGAAGVTRYDFRPDGPGLDRVAGWEAVVGIDHWWSDDRTLLALPTQKQAGVYECATTVRRFTVRHTHLLEYMAFSPDNRWLVGGAWKERHVKVWDAATGAESATLETPPTARPVFAPAGALVIGTGSAYQFYAAGTWRPGLRIPREDCGQTPGTAAFTPDGTVFAGWCRRGAVALWDLRTGRELVTLPVTARTGSLETHGELKFSPDGRRLFVVADRRHIQVWDLAALRARLAAAGLDWGGRTSVE